MVERRLLGIDLGIASAHTAVVLRSDGTEVCRRRCHPSVESFGELEREALQGAPEGTRLEIVIEPTGPAWLPVAVFFGRRHPVFRVSSQKAADLRRFLHRHAKSNSIDAATLARLPLVDPASLHPVELPGRDRATLDRRVRACDRLTREASEHKVRIKDLVRQLMPMTPLTGDLTRADLAVLERWADPNALLRAGKSPVDGPDRQGLAQPPGNRAGRGVVPCGPGLGAALRRGLRGRLRRSRRRGGHRGTAPASHRG